MVNMNFIDFAGGIHMNKWWTHVFSMNTSHHENPNHGDLFAAFCDCLCVFGAIARNRAKQNKWFDYLHAIDVLFAIDFRLIHPFSLSLSSHSPALFISSYVSCQRVLFSITMNWWLWNHVANIRLAYHIYLVQKLLPITTVGRASNSRHLINVCSSKYLYLRQKLAIAVSTEHI